MKGCEAFTAAQFKHGQSMQDVERHSCFGFMPEYFYSCRIICLFWDTTPVIPHEKWIREKINSVKNDSSARRQIDSPNFFGNTVLISLH